MEQENQSLSELEFVDLIIGSDFCEIRGLKGSDGANHAAPAHLANDIQTLRNTCRQTARNQGQSEFTTTLNGTRFRVTVMHDVTSEDIFILSRIGNEIRDFEELGFPDRLTKHLLRQDLTGLVVISGPMGVGKTSTAASLFTHRLKLHGGLGLALEDPPETPLSGQHGKGRAIQVEVSREHGGYQEQLTRSLRSRADVFMIGETREPYAAIEVMRVSGNGWPIITTTHADTVEQTLQKLQGLCRSMDASTDGLNAMLADSISAVVCLRLQKVPVRGGHVKRLLPTWLVVEGNEKDSIRSKIRKGDFASLNTEIAAQANSTSWGNKQ